MYKRTMSDDSDFEEDEWLPKKKKNKSVLTESLDQFGPVPELSFDCDCGRSFDKIKSLTSHRNVCKLSDDDKAPKVCDECHITVIGGKRGMSIHKSFHNKNEEPILCSECGKFSKGARSFASHNRLHQEMRDYPGPHTCGECSRSFDTQRGLKLHKSHVHIVDKEFKCDSCKKSFDSVRKLLEHKKNHSPEYACGRDGCTKKFVFKCALANHILDWHGSEEERTCKNCGKVWSSLKQANNHKKSICGSSKVILPSVIPQEPEALLQCQQCDKAYLTYSQLNAHMRVHNLKYKCDVAGCGQAFMRPYALTKHVRMFHPTEDELKCDICDLLLSDYNALRHHRRLIHKNDRLTWPVEKRIYCRVCSSWFFSRQALYGHMSKGHTERYYLHKKGAQFSQTYKKCQECEYICPRVTTLRFHIEKVHRITSPKQDINPSKPSSILPIRISGKFVYRCDLCSKEFDTSFQVLCHKRRGHFFDERHSHPVTYRHPPAMFEAICGINTLPSNTEIIMGSKEEEEMVLESIKPKAKDFYYSCYMMASADRKWVYFGTLRSRGQRPCTIWSSSDNNKTWTQNRSISQQIQDEYADKSLEEEEDDADLFFDENSFTNMDVPEGIKFYYLGRQQFKCDKTAPDFNAAMDCAWFTCAYRQAVQYLGNAKYPKQYKKSYNILSRRRGFSKCDWNEVKKSLFDDVAAKKDPLRLTVPLHLCRGYDEDYVTFKFISPMKGSESFFTN